MSIIFLCLVDLVVEDRSKRYFGYNQVGKKIYTLFVSVGHQQLAATGPYINKKKKT